MRVTPAVTVRGDYQQVTRVCVAPNCTATFTVGEGGKRGSTKRHCSKACKQRSHRWKGERTHSQKQEEMIEASDSLFTLFKRLTKQAQEVANEIDVYARLIDLNTEDVNTEMSEMFRLESEALIKQHPFLAGVQGEMGAIGDRGAPSEDEQFSDDIPF